MPPKHRLNEGEKATAEETAQKRKKYDTPAAYLVDDLEETMNAIKEQLPPKYHIGPGIYAIPRTLLNPGTSAETVSTQLNTFKRYCQLKRDAISAKIESLTDGLELADLIEGKVDFDKLLSIADNLQIFVFLKPPPSGYADVNIWKQMQAYPRPILCLRPTDKHGLPLVLLHKVFSQFQQLSRGGLPNSSAGVNVLRVALRLCSSMGDAFDNENARGMAFDEAMGGFLQGVDVRGRCMIIREDKVEIGKAGDAYPLVARSFDMACEEMEANGVTPDAPVFLLCVMGPSLTIAGGFKDGNDTVVEPLSPILLMLKDMDNVNGRAIQLATHLFALHSCLEQLPLLPNPASPAPGTPRVFASFRDAKNAQDTDHMLTFRRQLSTDQLLFNAVDEKSRELCVKIVYRPYGEDVHRMLAREGMAPKLLGVSRIDGGPTMIVMEMLDEPWQTLYVFAQSNPRWADDSVKLAIRKRLDDIVIKLEGGGLVHGDFRANNIMVLPGKEESAVVIDFDWAGKAGGVTYPLDRNHIGIQWPGEPGSPIHSRHDQSMLETQWKSLLNPKSR